MKPLLNPYLATLMLCMAAKAAGADRLADPTRPAEARATPVAATQDGVRVEAVMRSRERDVAIVNGQVVRAGDRIGAVLVAEILPDGVRYVRDGQTHVARIHTSTLQVRRPLATQDQR
jgi:hypothetical protein